MYMYKLPLLKNHFQHPFNFCSSMAIMTTCSYSYSTCMYMYVHVCLIVYSLSQFNFSRFTKII